MLLAFCFAHIQQAHYYTVDPLLTATMVLCLYLIQRMPQAGAGTYAACSVLVGTAVGTRLVGVLLVVPFVVQHLPTDWYRRPVRVLRDLLSVRTGLFVAALLAAAVACEPFSVLEPGRFFGDDVLLTWRQSLKVSLGEVVFPWSLYDLGTEPFLFHLTDLLPYSLGLPLFAASIAGCVLAVVLRNRAALVLLSWIVVYFVAVGGHHLKPVRYARIRSGDLGFSPASRFRIQPGIGPVQLPRRYDEPTMTAFDHPTVTIYRRNDEAEAP